MSKTVRKVQKGEEIREFDGLDDRLTGKLQELRECVNEAHDSYSLEVEGMKYGSVSVVIESSDWILNKGEVGDSYFHVILGPRGGLRTARHSYLLGGSYNLVELWDTKGKAWRSLKDRVKRAR